MTAPSHLTYIISFKIHFLIIFSTTSITCNSLNSIIYILLFNSLVKFERFCVFLTDSLSGFWIPDAKSLPVVSCLLGLILLFNLPISSILLLRTVIFIGICLLINSSFSVTEIAGSSSSVDILTCRQIVIMTFFSCRGCSATLLSWPFHLKFHFFLQFQTSYTFIMLINELLISPKKFLIHIIVLSQKQPRQSYRGMKLGDLQWQNSNLPKDTWVCQHGVYVEQTTNEIKHRIRT